ncbi:hypothetical protein E2C01_023431 [Portunus trituberculatus]|uniref:Uncharacterized protein n=1 Tax=Portunus trituberculatus TaxID=210409 RepID=A0A5B7E863_PORTR|nr:hypothetical protein [Portunus trituberculatus]
MNVETRHGTEGVTEDDTAHNVLATLIKNCSTFKILNGTSQTLSYVILGSLSFTTLLTHDTNERHLSSSNHICDPEVMCPDVISQRLKEHHCLHGRQGCCCLCHTPCNATHCSSLVENHRELRILQL